MRYTRPGLVKYDTDLMSVAFHLPDVYHEQYEAVHRDHGAQNMRKQILFKG